MTIFVNTDIYDSHLNKQVCKVGVLHIDIITLVSQETFYFKNMASEDPLRTASTKR